MSEAINQPIHSCDGIIKQKNRIKELRNNITSIIEEFEEDLTCKIFIKEKTKELNELNIKISILKTANEEIKKENEEIKLENEQLKTKRKAENDLIEELKRDNEQLKTKIKTARTTIIEILD